MKTKEIVIITAIAAVGWYFYRTSKGLPFLPSGIITAPGSAAPVATSSSAASGAVSTAGTISTITGDVNTILSNLTGTAGDLGINSTSTPDTSNSGLDDLANTV